MIFVSLNIINVVGNIFFYSEYHFCCGYISELQTLSMNYSRKDWILIAMILIYFTAHSFFDRKTFVADGAFEKKAHDCYQFLH